MRKEYNVVKAYKNVEFLSSPDARTVRILAEYYEPKARFEKNKINHTIVFFGSARLKSEKEMKKTLAELKKKDDGSRRYSDKIKQTEKLLKMSRYYDDAVALSRKLTEYSLSLNKKSENFVICSGGGPGIMEAANKGAALAGGQSVGLNISIPFEQFVNKYVKPDLAFEFHYFFMRKLWFVDLASALIVFPGGFGTMDEMMEVLTLIQTGKMKKKLKVIIYDSAYWKKIINFDELVELGVIGKKDLQLVDFCETIDDVYEKVIKHFQRNYL